MRSRSATLAALMLGTCVAIAGCTGGGVPGPARSTVAAPAPTPSYTFTAVNPPASVLQATAPTAAALSGLGRGPLPADEISVTVHADFPSLTSTSVYPLAVQGSFLSGRAFTLAGAVARSGPGRTALVRVMGPGFDGRRVVAATSAGVVGATVRLPKLTRGRWVVAIEDLSKVTRNSSGQEQGSARLDLAIYNVG